MALSHFQNVFLVSPQMEPNANDAKKAIMVKNVPRNVIVMEMKGNFKHCKDAVIIWIMVRVVVFNAIFNNISVIS